jgi:hypothetical protein
MARDDGSDFDFSVKKITKRGKNKDDSQSTSTEKRKRTNRWSNFFLTINTNKRFYKTEENYPVYKHKLTEVIDTFLGNKKNIVHFIKHTDGQLNFSDIKKISVESVLELGPKTRTLHAHVLIKIFHRTNIRLDPLQIQSVILEAFNEDEDTHLENIYINIRASSNQSDNILRYMSKQYEVTT